MTESAPSTTDLTVGVNEADERETKSWVELTREAHERHFENMEKDRKQNIEEEALVFKEDALKLALETGAKRMGISSRPPTPAREKLEAEGFRFHYQEAGYLHREKCELIWIEEEKKEEESKKEISGEEEEEESKE